ncbi:hypothetical protein N7472_007284 [Penicillium cf. griseofulvum]|uniref:Protein kinase domain-containing protein n=1 Tax=Penicillium cf. griseofulvum TaxID=2972120 RepID=A0A9W9J0R8_9EURO|nr:hypothetical protein N7472_007284 [Penicillium cf. griseofulvum]
MTLPSRQSDFDARLLRRLVGTKVTTFYDFDRLQQPSAVSSSASAISPSAAPPSWSLPSSGLALSYLAYYGLIRYGPYPFLLWFAPPRERPLEDVEMGVGSPITVGKFLCHLEEDPTQIAFMRIYYQIPITGTEDANLATLAQQIQPYEVCGELEAFRLLMSQGCSSVPRFLGYYEKKQEEHDLVPGGYIKYLVWEKVPGEPLTEEFFWSLDPLVRENIRAQFRIAFEEILRCGVKPQESRISKIIYDQSTGKVRISGFRRGWPIREKLQWSDTRYIAYMLAKRPDKRDWRSRPEEWEL